jgi:molecular chaperone DnaK (HSP70)
VCLVRCEGRRCEQRRSERRIDSRRAPLTATPRAASQASELSYAQQIARTHVGSEIKDCVIVVPPYWGPHQRRALLDSAEIAGVNVLALMHSHAAAALQYGIERDFTNRTESVILYDVASRDVVAALVDYSAYAVRGSAKQRSQVKVRDVAYREGVGANELDGLLMRHFANEASFNPPPPHNTACAWRRHATVRLHTEAAPCLL